MRKLPRVMKEYNVPCTKHEALAPQGLYVKTEISDEWVRVFDYGKYIKNLDLPKGSKIRIKHITTMCWSEYV